MKVEVYKNLHKDCWSVRSNKTGQLLGHVQNIHLQHATLVVRPAGRARVLREHRKNVHAFIKGDMGEYSLEDRMEVRPYKDLEKGMVIYNPYLYDSFVMKDTKKPIHYADAVYLTASGTVYVEDNND